MNNNYKVVAMYNKNSPFPGLYQLILNEKNKIKRIFFEYLLKKKLNKKQFIKNIVNNNFYQYQKKNNEKLRILDLGCGTGENTVAFAQYFYKSEIVGIDASKSSILLAKKLKKKLNLENLNFKIFNFEKQNIKELGKFNFIICAGVLHHLNNPKKELKKISKLLDKNSVLILKIYNKNGLHLEMQTRSAIKEIFPNDPKFKNSINFIKESNLKRGLQKKGHPSGKKIIRFVFKLKVLFEYLKSFGTSPYFSLQKFFTEEYDAFVNPIVHYYDSKKILELIKNTNLKFINFYLNSSHSKSFEQLIEKKIKTKDKFKILSIKEKLLGPTMTTLVLKKNDTFSK
tara:strand:+ start:40144 stop:41166 length:1023 start_codon:yes stop_codon:yes gene_type:complete